MAGSSRKCQTAGVERGCGPVLSKAVNSIKKLAIKNKFRIINKDVWGKKRCGCIKKYTEVTKRLVYDVVSREEKCSLFILISFSIASFLQCKVLFINSKNVHDTKIRL